VFESIHQDESDINKMSLILESSVKKAVFTEEVKMKDVTRLKNFLASNSSDSGEGSRASSELEVPSFDAPRTVILSLMELLILASLNSNGLDFSRNCRIPVGRK
jgi:hypothetical protein